MAQRGRPRKENGPTELLIDEIKVPDLRVTSQVDPHIMEELLASISRDGILQPLQVARVADKYVIEDGLHRLVAAKQLGLATVPCLVHKATGGEVLVRNLVLNRQRGKSNPAEECKVIRYLAETEGKELQEIMGLTGLSEPWARKLLHVAYLPQEVRDLVEDGFLSISAAAHLVKLEGPEQQISVGRDAANWKYTEEQIKNRIADLQGIRPPPTGGQVAFQESGEPVVIPIKCEYCRCDMTDRKNYRWVCDKCEELLDEFWRAYTQGVSPALSVVEEEMPKGYVLTERGWERGG